MDKINKEFDHSLEHRLKLFAEINPNPIILLNFLGEIIFLNLSARTQFPTIAAEGKHHAILSMIIQELKKYPLSGKELIVFSQDIKYLDTTYEQQIFAIHENDTIFIYMIDMTEKKRFEDEIRSIKANHVT